MEIEIYMDELRELQEEKGRNFRLLKMEIEILFVLQTLKYIFLRRNFRLLKMEIEI